MIVKAFRDFLLDTTVLNDSVRDGGRQVFQDAVQWRVSDGRIPRSKGGVVAVTLSQIEEESFGTISVPLPLVATVIQVTIWAKDTDELSGAERGRAVAASLRDMLVQYSGALNDDVSVQTIMSQGGASEQLLRPSDASGNWAFRYIATYRLGVPIAVPAGAS